MSEHKHLCPKCATVWEHDRYFIKKRYPILEKAHECPKCGTYNGVIYKGDLPVEFPRYGEIKRQSELKMQT